MPIYIASYDVFFVLWFTIMIMNGPEISFEFEVL